MDFDRIQLGILFPLSDAEQGFLGEIFFLSRCTDGETNFHESEIWQSIGTTCLLPFISPVIESRIGNKVMLLLCALGTYGFKQQNGRVQFLEEAVLGKTLYSNRKNF